MNEQECLDRMIAPGTPRPGKYRQGVIQVLLTSSCDKACYSCTQGSQLRRKPWFMTPDQFEAALRGLEGWWGVVGVFGGNPALSPHFEDCCDLLCKYFPKEQRGLWCNNPLGKGAIMRRTFDPAVSNLNVHLDRAAYDEFKRDWPECGPVGLDRDSRHSPPFVAMKDLLPKECPRCRGAREIDRPDPASGRTSGEWVGSCPTCNGSGQVYDEERAWELISKCDINIHWSSMIGVFRGKVRAWFCEIAGAQAMLHQDEPDYPETGYDLDDPYLVANNLKWWELPMAAFADQVRLHCHSCGVPLRGYGELAQTADADGIEQVTTTHANVYKPKRPARRVEVVTHLEQLGIGRLARMTDYLGNSKR